MAVISVVSTLLLVFPLGVLIGCCGAVCGRRYCGVVCARWYCSKQEDDEDSKYETVDRVKVGVAINKTDNLGHVRQI